MVYCYYFSLDGEPRRRWRFVFNKQKLAALLAARMSELERLPKTQNCVLAGRIDYVFYAHWSVTVSFRSVRRADISLREHSRGWCKVAFVGGDEKGQRGVFRRAVARA